MELRQLEYFVAVVEEGGFTRAAERAHVAQPGVSAQIRQLERELGQPLLDRSGRGVRLTGAGAAVLPYARAALAAVEGARTVVDELTGLVRGHVAVGMVTACPAGDFTDLLAGFHRARPGVEVVLSEDTSDRLVQGLRDGRFDLAWIGLAGDRPAGIDSHVVVDEPVVAGVPFDDPLAGRASVALRDLRDRSLVCLPRGTGVRTALEDACAGLGFAPRVAVEAASLATVMRLASQGLGVAMLPASVAADVPDLHTLAIVRPRPHSRLELAWRAEGQSTPAGRALVSYARTALAGLPDR